MCNTPYRMTDSYIDRLPKKWTNHQVHLRIFTVYGYFDRGLRPYGPYRIASLQYEWRARCPTNIRLIIIIIIIIYFVHKVHVTNTKFKKKT